LDTIPLPAVASLASAVNSQDNPSANGRSISSTRWNSHYLVKKGDTTTTESSPIPAFTNATPDWVFVKTYNPVTPTQSPGPFVITSPDPLVVGRYAYAVYDEGGLLDINVAGCPIPSTLPPSWTTDVGRKGVLAFADLTALPATTANPPNAMTSTAINQAILFRNYATSQTSSVTLADSATVIAAAFNSGAPFFANYYLGNPRIGTSQDFGSVNPTKIGTGSSIRTDQNFATRAQLIALFRSGSSLPQNINALQYLGTFSREQNKPTFQLSAAWPFPVTDTTHTRIVLPKRFYLGNLNEVVNPGNAGNIRTYFGLQFASVGNPGSGPCDNQVRWKYVGQGINTTPLSAIPAFPSDLTTLDFFQYINYALFGVTISDPDSTHIASTLQIGASLIDQYDTDALITGIYYGGSNPATCDPLNACPVYGAEQNQNETGWSLMCISPQPPMPTLSGVFVNRPLRNVGEFSYAYNLLDAINNHNGGGYLTDFKDPYDSSTNTDPVLLDFFTYNSAPVRSGIVSLNTRQPLVLAAILQGAIYNNSLSNVVSPSDAATAANSILNDATNGTIVKPAMSRADITRLASAAVVTNSPFTNNEEARDTIARALSEVVQTRTWGLLIDLVAQTGHYKPNATSLTNDFVVEGEKRYWLHVAIDRFDGTIVGQQLEEVTE
jgi:hypothetical protein